MSVDTASPSTPQLEVARIRLFLERELHEREAIVRDSAPNAAPNIDPVTWATNVAARRVSEQILAAMARLDAGTYGDCVRCGKAVGAARLDVVPYAENCVDCQRNVDRS